jgi:hypothetical protein
LDRFDRYPEGLKGESEVQGVVDVIDATNSASELPHDKGDEDVS